jgi:hypothetical protein
VPDARRQGGGRLDDRVQIDAGGDAQAIQHVDKVLGCEVAGCARGVRAAAESAGRRVERLDPKVQRGQHIRQRRAARVVKVERDSAERHTFGDGVHHLRDLSRMGNADGVAHRDLECAHGDQCFGNFSYPTRVDVTLEWASEGSGEVGANAQAERSGAIADDTVRLE